jgi:transcriptional regulator with XRE-family HTH domain
MLIVSSLLSLARVAAGLSMTDLAARAGTSRPTLSAYEHGRVSPTLDTVERIVAAAGCRLEIVRTVEWRSVEVGRGRTAAVPDHLPDLPVNDAVRIVSLPLHLEWSRRNRDVDLSDRRQRASVYETVLREGRPGDIEMIVDGALLVDLWTELVLPRRLRAAWQPLIDAAREPGG